MLDMPDFYKTISEIAMKKTLHDIENDMIPDYEKVDSLREEKFPDFVGLPAFSTLIYPKGTLIKLRNYRSLNMSFICIEFLDVY